MLNYIPLCWEWCCLYVTVFQFNMTRMLSAFVLMYAALKIILFCVKHHYKQK